MRSCRKKHKGKIGYIKPVEEIGVSSGFTYGESGAKEKEIGKEENNGLPFTFSDVKEFVEVFHELTLP